MIWTNFQSMRLAERASLRHDLLVEDEDIGMRNATTETHIAVRLN